MLPSLLVIAMTAQAPAPEAPKPPQPQAAPAAEAPKPNAPAAAPVEAPKPPMPGPAGMMPPRPGQPGPVAEEPKEDTILAFLGKRAIREKDFITWLKLVAGPQAEMVRKNPQIRERAKKQFLETQVLSAKALAEKIQDTKDYKDLLAVQKQQALVRTLMNEEREGGDGKALKARIENPSEEEIQAYFQQNLQRYETPEKFTARHILVSLKGAPGIGDKGLTDEEAKAKIAKIQEELKSGKKLEELAKDYSDDPGSKTNGGLYKDITYGRFAKEFEEAVRTQEIGKVGEPVKTQFGYHLIEVESRTPKQAAELEKVRETVKKQMVPERREKLTKEYIDNAKKELGYREPTEEEKDLPEEKPVKASKKAVKAVKPEAASKAESK